MPVRLGYRGPAARTRLDLAAQPCVRQLFACCKTSLLLPLLLGCSLLRQAGSSMFERPTLSFKEARLP